MRSPYEHDGWPEAVPDEVDHFSNIYKLNILKTDIQIEYFLDKCSILTFQTETTSLSFHLNATLMLVVAAKCYITI